VKEYVNDTFGKFCKEVHIKHQFNISYTTTKCCYWEREKKHHEDDNVYATQEKVCQKSCGKHSCIFCWIWSIKILN